MRFASSLAALCVCAGVFATTAPAPAKAGNIYSALKGSWSGSGSVRTKNGQREKLRCTAYYTPQGTTGAGMAIRCASKSANFHMRGSLRGTSAVSGTWEERTFNATGSVSGRATGSTLRLSIRGSVSGSLSITLRGNTKSVSLSTGNAGSVAMTFSRR